MAEVFTASPMRATTWRVETKQQGDQEALSAHERLGVLTEEYRALYALALFRLQALDRRVPLALSTLVASLAAVFALPWDAQMVVFVAVPVSLIWVTRTTIGHAKSLEDCFRRIEQIELQINRLAGEPLLMFQSLHPSRGRTTGGRSSLEVVVSVLLASALVLAATGWLARPILTRVNLEIFFGFLVCIGVYLLTVFAALHRYRYEPIHPPTEPPVHTAVCDSAQGSVGP